jgi:hypothetical protein
VPALEPRNPARRSLDSTLSQCHWKHKLACCREVEASAGGVPKSDLAEHEWLACPRKWKHQLACCRVVTPSWTLSRDSQMTVKWPSAGRFSTRRRGGTARRRLGSNAPDRRSNSQHDVTWTSRTPGGHQHPALRPVGHAHPLTHSLGCDDHRWWCFPHIGHTQSASRR